MAQFPKICAALVLLGLILAGCTTYKVPDASKIRGVSETGQTELTVWLWPGTGLERLISIYQQENPDLKITVQTGEFEDVHDNLRTAFAAGYGAPDISLIETNYIDRFKTVPSRFYNLFDYGAAGLQNVYLDWKWQQAQSVDGSFLFGLPTDIGPLAMIYRKDIFAEAGLPTDREAVARLIRTWDDLIAAGKRVKQRTGKAMFDNLGNVYRSVASQAETLYFDKYTDSFIAERNPMVLQAWKYAADAAAGDLTAKIPSWMPEWEAGVNKGEFAVVLAPAWMMGLIKQNAPDAAGKWDIAQLPGTGGNWGGSFLTMPREGAHPEEAYQLIQWLTAPSRQLDVFVQNGNFPSTPSLFDDDKIKEKKDDYFSGAPVGILYSQAAKKVKPLYEGPYAYIATKIFNDAIWQMERHLLTPEEAWQYAIDRTERELEQY
ncbi:MAG TPA: ABC transporter substrate-binding protein [Paenibacillus sp.]|uniref:ABC transporter substrate-binding protein n=1 Tax=Paenibacillus sp. TaxID=58172 RepID=UPI002B869B13|nr:ABC transporter substrate-binding protein [Paenibacillus sp.]HUC91673.1 ABC transporter substrate-binding protein [Paenibacillus sp.]